MLVDYSKKQPVKKDKSEEHKDEPNNKLIKLLLFGAVPLSIRISSVFSKIWKIPDFVHIRFLIGTASVESIVYSFISWLTKLEVLSSFSNTVLIITQEASLVISCLIFMALLIIEGLHLVSERYYKLVIKKRKHALEEK
jgi:hypothetical protein